MDAWFIWSLILLVLTLIALFVRSKAKDPGAFSDPRPETDSRRLYESSTAWEQRKDKYDESREGVQAFRSLMNGVAGTLGLLTAVFLIMSCFVIVGTNQVGVMTSFSKPQTAHSNGFVVKLPWEIKTEFDGTQQFMRFEGDGNDEEDLDKKTFPKIEVKLDGQAKAFVSGTIAWQMKAGTATEKANAVELFKTYKTFERLTKNLVSASAKKAIGEVFAHHNPLDPAKNQSLGELNKMALEQLRKEFGTELTIVSVDLRVPDYDDQTDKAIGDMQAQKAETKKAEELELTNKAKAAANAALEASVQNPAVNVANCIQAAIQMGKEPGFCLMGSSSVMVNAGGQQK